MQLLGILCWLGLLCLTFGMPAQAHPIRIVVPDASDAGHGAAYRADGPTPADRPAPTHPPAGPAISTSGDGEPSATSRTRLGDQVPPDIGMGDVQRGRRRGADRSNSRSGRATAQRSPVRDTVALLRGHRSA